ncbi:MAG: hypothetical protein AB7I32_04695 [Gammaproteobacteria bacterium]
MKHHHYFMTRVCHALVAACCALPLVAGAQQGQPFAYPNGGQSQEQQAADRFQCHQWSVSQTGFDPTTAPPLAAPMAVPPPPPPNYGYSDQPPPQQQQSGGFLGLGNGGFFQGGGVVGDAATGAALGAAGGAIAGNAGKGAAIGALASTVFGAVSRSSQQSAPPPPQGYNYYQQQQQQYYQQTQAANQQAYDQRQRQTADYGNAYAACMKSRNYTVN